jgi:hypothetical protein
MSKWRLVPTCVIAFLAVLGLAKCGGSDLPRDVHAPCVVTISGDVQEDEVTVPQGCDIERGE